MISKASFLLLVLIAIGLAILPSNAGESHAELYWKAKMGNTRMPIVLKDSLLPPGSSNEIVNLTQIYKHNSLDQSLWGCAFEYAGCRLEFSEYALRDETPLPKDDQVIFFTYDSLFSNPRKQLKGSKTMKLNLGKTNFQPSKFLPLKISTKLTPLSTTNLQNILHLVSINPKSTIANRIEATIRVCEEKGVKDEVRYCATSLEGMLDYVTLQSTQNKVNLYYNNMEEESGFKEYKIQKLQKIENGKDNTIVCHKTDNPFAVFVCHNIKKTDAYVTSLVSENGKKVKAIVMCHKDTSSWNSEHLAFRILKIKPGSKTVCHFLSANAVAWVPY